MAKQSINWKESVEGTQQLVKHLGAKLLLETSIEKQEELRHEIGKLKNQEHVILVNELASEGIDKLNEEMRNLEERYQSYDLSQRHMFKTETTVTKEKSKKVKENYKPKDLIPGSVHYCIDHSNYQYAYYCGKNNRRSESFIKYFNSVEKSALKEWSKYINNYKSPYGYMSWDWIMNRIIMEFKTSMRSLSLVENTNVLDIINSYVFNSSFMSSTPSPIFLTHDLIKDFINTDVKGFDASSNEVYPFYTLMLPKNALGLDLKFDEEPNENIRENYYALLVMTNDIWIKSVENVIGNHKMHDSMPYKHWTEIIANLKKSINPDNYLPGEYGLNQFKSGFKVIALNDKAGYMRIDFIWEEGTKNWEVKYADNSIARPSEDTKGHEVVGKAILNIVANSILLMSYQPEHVTVQSPEINRGFGTSERDEPKQATWLGEHYKQTQVRYEYPPEHVPQKGKSPRSHWRRGHMHTILQGPGRKQRVLKWIKPTFIVGRGTT